MNDYPDEPDDEICSDGYPEHKETITYEGPDGVAWTCDRCGAEGWDPTEDEE